MMNGNSWNKQIISSTVFLKKYIPWYHQKGQETSLNSVATIFAWTRGLSQRGKLDDNSELVQFADRLEKAAVSTISEDGIMTKDLAMLKYGLDKEGFMQKEHYKSTEQFIDAVCQKMLTKHGVMMK